MYAGNMVVIVGPKPRGKSWTGPRLILVWKMEGRGKKRHAKLKSGKEGWVVVSGAGGVEERIEMGDLFANVLVGRVTVKG